MHPGVDGRRAPAAFIGAGESPVMTPDCDAAQSSLGGIVRHAQAAVIEITGECGPAAEAVLDRFGGLVLGGELGALLAQPSLQRSGERPAALPAHTNAFVRRGAVDLGKRPVKA